MGRKYLSGRTRYTRRWRAGVVAFLAVATSALVAGIAYGFFTSSGSGTGSASVGTLALSVGGPPATTACNYRLLSPGDLTGSQTCSLAVIYTGTAPAFVSLTVEVQSAAGLGGSLLYDGSNSTGLTFSISDGVNSYAVPTGFGTTGAPCPAGFTCWTAPNDLAAWYSGSTPNLIFANTDAVTWTVTPLFPTSVGNAYQGAAANLILTAQAMQGSPNPISEGCTTSTIGKSCPASGSFTWG